MEQSGRKIPVIAYKHATKQYPAFSKIHTIIQSSFTA
jgi:hypothetical protein